VAEADVPADVRVDKPDLSRLPRVDALADRVAAPSHTLAVAAARQAIAEARAAMLAGGGLPSDDALIERARAWLAARARPTLRRVVNATGIVVHTNLGRAPLPAEAVAPALGYCNLEYDLATGDRGSRRALLEPLLCELSGAEAALVVNNCAAALVLALAAIKPIVRTAEGPEVPEVIVSRGELVEIGGSFRIPSILESAGVALREVGTTNRTYPADYERAITTRTVAILRVHASNFAMSGFVAAPPLAALVALARGAKLPLLVDLGSDALDAQGDPARGDHDQTVRAALAAGADLVMLSGDKLLGGPQAGLCLGRRALVDRMAGHPLMRALRPDKLALAALDYVLRARAADTADAVPVHHMLALGRPALMARAERLASTLRAAGLQAVAVPTDDAVGGGSHPDLTLPGAGIALGPPEHLSLDAWAARLRLRDPPVVARLWQQRLVIALRTVSEAEEPDLVSALVSTLDIGRPAI